MERDAENKHAGADRNQNAGKGGPHQSAAHQEPSFADLFFAWLKHIPAAPERTEGGQTKSENERQDLEAQKAMAVWAFWMALAGGVSVGVGVWGIFLIWRTLAATHQSNRITRESAQHQLRAYLSLTPAGIRYDTKARKLVVYIKQSNSGQTPAKKVRFWAATEVLPHPLPQETALPQPAYGKSVNVVSPDQGFTVPAVHNPEIYEMDLAAYLLEKQCIYVIASLEYVDIFGEPQTTDACWSYYNNELMEVMRKHEALARSIGAHEDVVQANVDYAPRHNEAT